MSYAKHLRAPAPQSQPIAGRVVEMAPNAAGGWGFKLDKWVRFERFLILGAEGGTYYVTEKQLTKESAEAALECLAEAPLRYVDLVADVHGNNRAPKWKPAVFALALASVYGDINAKTAVRHVAPKLLRTGAQLLYFVSACDAMGKWRRNLRTTVANWFLSRESDQVAYQAIKYQARDGWAMRDILRLAHPKTKDPVMKAVFDRICGRATSDEVPLILDDEAKMRRAVSLSGPAVAVNFANALPREALPSEVNGLKEYWHAVIGTMPATALVRNLATMTRLGLMDEPGFRAQVVARLGDVAWLKKARVHPMALLLANMAYSKGGEGTRSRGGSFTPNVIVSSALEHAFEQCFSMETTLPGPLLVACDVSGSMSSHVDGSPALTAKEAAAAIALVIAKASRGADIKAFNEACPAVHSSYSYGFGRVSAQQGAPYTFRVDNRSTLGEVRTQLEAMAGGTDCASPINYALSTQKSYKGIIIISDQDSWAGRVHVTEAMKSYRMHVNPDAKLIVMAMNGQGTTLVDPQDPKALGIAGFDLAAFEAMEWFLRS